ncbi:delta 1-pyrroline-5-carboxylate synthetase [Fragilariopsis cylindrus CCMP1102]|uniref:Delta-1-pyrroline-5-carboxylate synthase n=1 Tax=Fragilariopsis cylindrus CCMP1102 TaxID=635003 RepID=A0A1E7F2G0_9STRA|nr:delta 1-pyrroline-5-carboxylate synthetase [Fragilariopsis cylindrus CCMP1102]|eukprot:OEU12370.1 delta 1-pyrroline-5-carboxylate synthetase [Fragilariopsis cylindrus CCMP1102]
MELNELSARNILRNARRICVKAGTSVVANENGRPSLTRLGAIVEQISELNARGAEVIFVSSGAVGMGKRLLQKQSRMLMSFKDTMHSQGNNMNNSSATNNQFTASQFDLMNLYSSLFTQCDVAASQILVTQGDFVDQGRLENLKYTVERLLSHGIVPIINENDAVSANLGYTADDVFSDNDSLAALCARNFNADVLVMLTDVDGVFDRCPSESGAKMLELYIQKSSDVAIGAISAQGRGGMASKIDAALSAVSPGSNCTACIVTSGNDLNAIRGILGPDDKFGSKGTLFCTPDTNDPTDDISDEAREKAVAARNEARKLQALPHEVRQDILRAMADALIDRKDELLTANAIDLEAAERDGVAMVLKKRLKLSDEKFETLSEGLRQIADLPDPLGVEKSKRELADGMELSLITVPIGVLMIIFESRPDSMPQIAALSIASGNGLLLKGGKEAANSNAAIYKVLGDAIEVGSKGAIKKDIIALITSRGQVSDMLALDDVIDLVIPRGSNALVSYIKANTKIPVLGHADGVCHVYIDKSASASAATKIAVDSKTDYPSACNAMESLLVHKDTISNGVAAQTLMSLRAAGVKCLGGPKAMKIGLCDTAAKELKREYGDLTCLVEVVENVDEAIDWIHSHGSGHTESIVCSPDSEVGEEFLCRVDAACVFKNASTRFADGYRFGLGAEVGISTGRIHARGPVGVEGLLTTKWQLRSNDINLACEYSTGEKKFTHKELM